MGKYIGITLALLPSRKEVNFGVHHIQYEEYI